MLGAAGCSKGEVGILLLQRLFQHTGEEENSSLTESAGEGAQLISPTAAPAPRLRFPVSI